MKEQNATEKPAIRFHCIDAILVSLSIEKQGLKFYEKAARKSQDPKVRKMFQYLADEEKEHIQTLQEKAQFLQPVLHKKVTSRKQVENFIAENLQGKVFPEMKGGKGADFSSDAEALDLGILSEQKSINMLNELLLQERKLEVRAIFLHLLVEEKKHLACLEELRKSFT